MTLKQRKAFRERPAKRREGMVDGWLTSLADNPRAALILFIVGMVAIGGGLLAVWLL